MELTDKSKAWEFVEKYYPGYSKSDLIMRANDLSKIVDEPETVAHDIEAYHRGEIEKHQMCGAAVVLVNEFGGKFLNPDLLEAYYRVHEEVFERAIEGYIKSLAKKKWELTFLEIMDLDVTAIHMTDNKDVYANYNERTDVHENQTIHLELTDVEAQLLIKSLELNNKL